ncbi:MAG: hypothetical protein LBC27_08875 [Spirochaetaceae bacterium]|jgi:hypothetical protein|nr:hypothetical protein [Spirochaetaceae bacterium]
MKRWFCAIFTHLFFVSAIFAVDWPLEGAVMTSNFGKSDMGHPMLGDSFRAEGVINTIENGELIFRRGVKSSSSRFTSPLGFMTALDHGDGLISIYSRAEALQSPPQKQFIVSTPVAAAGTSGWTKTKGFYLSIFDRKDRRWVNPSLVIPVRPDTRPPAIRSVRLKSRDNQMIDLAASRTIRQGAYTIIVHTEDTVLNDSDPPLMPMRIICSVNGVEASVLAFETFSARDGVLMLFRNGLVPASQIYAYAPAVEAGEVFFNRGQVTLEIIVQDIAALSSPGASSGGTSNGASNSRSAVYRLFVE